jgi:hypothetical protein
VTLLRGAPDAKAGTFPQVIPTIHKTEISLGDVDLEAVLFRLTRHAQGLFGAFRSLSFELVDVACPRQSPRS